MKVFKKVLIILIMFISILSVKIYAKTGTINIDATRLRKENNTTSEILTNIYEDEEVEILEELGEWIKIKYKNQVGFIKKEFINVKNEKPNDSEDKQNKEENKVSTYENETTAKQENTNSVTLLKTTRLRIIPSFMSKQK